MLMVFLVVLALYVAGFWGSEYLRQRRGPWVVTFATNASDEPFIEISQARLGINARRLVFPGTHVPALSLPREIRFTDPALTQAGLPFGRLKFIDTTVLPGTVTLDMFGHEIELLPRVLILDKREQAWGASRETRLPAGRP